MSIVLANKGLESISRIIEKLEKEISNYGISVEKSVAIKVRDELDKFITELKEYIEKVNQSLFPDLLLLSSFDAKLNTSIKSLQSENEILVKRIDNFNFKWTVYEISKSSKDFYYDFEYLSQKLKNRFAREQHLYSTLVLKNEISKN